MKLIHQMLVAPAACVLATAACVAVGIWSLHSVANRFETVRTGQFATKAKAGAVQLELATANVQIYRTLFLYSSLTAEDRKRATDSAQAAVARLSSNLGELSAAIAEKQRPVIDRLRPLVTAVKPQLEQSFRFAEMANEAMVVGALGAAIKTFKEVDETMQRTAAQLGEEADSAAAAVRATASAATVTLTLVGVAAICAALLLAWRMSVQITRRLLHVSRVSEEVSRGNLAVEIPRVGNDEVGDLMGTLSNTVQRLNQSMHEISQAAQQIMVSSSEVASGGQDLSNRTEQAAAALEQTSASMQQLGSAVGLSAEAAKEASQLATDAHGIAARGGEIVGRVVSTMDDINASSKRIADITGVIDGIAFQTNILALNAAVEAARAGDQGRGFAVVASEVRTLAQRSAAAAREIKALISASVERVDDGTRLVREAGQTMGEIVGSTQRLDKLMAELDGSSRAQALSVGEVGQAVSHLDSTTQQNAALVEQSAAAAESLKEQAHRLTLVVGTFSIDPRIAA